ncbi:sigma intracellular receptor 2-like [Hordeum vulgare subsp. vulgare]|uniref:EXPERA domain-containing protein n=1 Tax=Hordeum vulgare subsp. vulgare TaxID=112509 RepID=A0A8I6XJW1_HORVV|nr:sigma intracellular receptor 2-like [Hordeum vulgare subsp. vulgare]
MGAVSATADVVVALFSLIMAVAAPLFDSQVVLPRGLHPAPLVDIHRWFTVAFGHYLVADPPPFFLGFVWLDLAFLWPVCVANLYGILAGRRWSATTSLMAGVYMLTYLSAILGDMLGSGKATPRLLQLYAPFIVIAVTAVLRGLCSYSAPLTAATSVASAQKKKD